MKKVIIILFALMISAIANAFTGTTVIDGIKFFLIEKGHYAEVMSNNYSGDIVIPDSVEYNGEKYRVLRIDKRAFIACTGLTSVTIPNGLIIIEEYAFYGCTSLTSITIPWSVQIIEKYAFYGCSSLTTIIIGTQALTLRDYTFANCPNLLDVYLYKRSKPDSKESTFMGSSEYATLHVPEESLDYFKSLTIHPWIDFKDIIALTDTDPKPTAIKVIKNSRNKDVVFDLNGRQVERPSKGLFIKNGKKYIIK